MKAVYFKQVAAILDERVPQQLPGFEPFKLQLAKDERTTSNVERTDRVFRRRVREGLDLFLVFCPHPRQEELYVDLAWSTRGRFPFDLQRPSLLLKSGRGEFDREEAIFGGDQFFPRERGKSHLGWAVWRCSVGVDDPSYMQVFIQEDLAPVSEAQARSRAESAVMQGLADIKTWVLPYFDELISYKQPMAQA
jgi:hypothetical protein